MIFRPHEGPEVYLRRDPSKTYAGVDVPYAGTGGTSGASATGNSIYLVDTNTQYKYALRDGTAPNANIKTAAAATVQANKFLLDASEENDVAYVTLTVPNSKVNLIKAGMRLQLKMLHWPAPYNAWAWWRVNRRTLSWSLATDQLYDVAMELTPQIPVVPLYAALLWHGNGLYGANPDPAGPGGTVVGWSHTGDVPPGGFNNELTVGPATFTPNTGAGTSNGLIYRGVKLGEACTVAIDHHGRFGGTASGASTITVNIVQNSTIISTQTQVGPSSGLYFFGGDFDFQLSGIAGHVGDEFYVTAAYSGWAGFNYYAASPGDTNPNTHFRVTGS